MSMEVCARTERVSTGRPAARRVRLAEGQETAPCAEGSGCQSNWAYVVHMSGSIPLRLEASSPHNLLKFPIRGRAGRRHLCETSFVDDILLLCLTPWCRTFVTVCAYWPRVL